jgi:hypothetical protein
MVGLPLLSTELRVRFVGVEGVAASSALAGPHRQHTVNDYWFNTQWDR